VIFTLIAGLILIVVLHRLGERAAKQEARATSENMRALQRSIGRLEVIAREMTRPVAAEDAATRAGAAPPQWRPSMIHPISDPNSINAWRTEAVGEVPAFPPPHHHDADGNVNPWRQ
jgi:hypothetical protein